MRWISRCLLFVLLVFGSSALSSSPSLAIGCESITVDSSSFLSVTYYLTATSCTKSNPGPTLLLSASIDDFSATVTFLPASVVVASSVTSPACTHAGPPNSGNVAGYNFQQSVTCNVLISLTNGATLSFDIEFASDGFANSVMNVNFVPGVSNPTLTVAATASPNTFSNASQVIAYNYLVTNSGDVPLTSLAVTDTKVSPITCPVTLLLPGSSTTCTGSYTTVAADVIAGSISGTATATALFAAAVTSPSVTTTVLLDTNAVRQATQSAIRNFMNHRADMITSMSPDTGRMHQRLTGTLFGGDTGQAPSQLGGPAASALGGRDVDARIVDDAAGPRRPTRGGSIGDLGSGRAGATNPVNISGSTVDASGRFAFATSLCQIQQAAEAARDAQEASADGLMGLGAARRTAKPAKALRPPAFDVWAEGSFAYYENDIVDARQRGHASMLYLGFDYQLHPAILVGMLAQFDWMSESSAMLGTSASGQGWMAGPYLSARLTRNVFFDARAAWGRSDNRVDPLGVYTDSFSTDRSLVSGKLTGNWSFGAVQFRPSAEIVYFHETQKAYVNQINIFIPEQSVSLGRFTFGPEVAYRMRGPNGGILEPFIGLKGVWDFAKTADTTIAGTVIGNNPFRGKLEGGATYTAPSGVSVRASVSYDGIGDSDFQSYQGRAFVAVPLN